MQFLLNERVVSSSACEGETNTENAAASAITLALSVSNLTDWTVGGGVNLFEECVLTTIGDRRYAG